LKNLAEDGTGEELPRPAVLDTDVQHAEAKRRPPAVLADVDLLSD